LLLAVTTARADIFYTTNGDSLTVTGYVGGGSVTIPDSVDSMPVVAIGDNAFLSNFVAAVNVPDSVTNIGKHAFESCHFLTNATLGDGVVQIGDNAFYDCFSLRSLTIPDSALSLGVAACAYCPKLARVTLGNNLASLKDYTFYRCASLTDLTVPNSVASIGRSAFQFCGALTNVMLGNSVTNVGDSAFFDCTSLTTINVDASNPVYSCVDGVLFNQAQTSLFQYPAGKLGSYTIPATVTAIGGASFYLCVGLTGVTVPDTVLSIGDSAFEYCSSLPRLFLPASVTNIGNYAFVRCPSLTNIDVDPLNPAYSSINGVLFNHDHTTLIQYPAGKTGNYTVPNGVLNLGNYAFFGCTGLTSIQLGTTVSIGFAAFDSCAHLAGVDFPNSVASIGSYAFNLCTGLSALAFPNSVTNVGSSAFFGCTTLTAAYFNGNAPVADASVFQGATNATVYYFPATTGWGPVFGGRPAVLWNPRIETAAPDFGVQTNQFGFTITGATNLVVVVEVSVNPALALWSPLSTNVLAGGSDYFSDPGWTNYPARFYRLRAPEP